MLIVLYVGGHRYPLGPNRSWDGYLNDLEAALPDGGEMVRDTTQAIVRDRTTQHVYYRVALERWPTEREVWSTERS